MWRDAQKKLLKGRHKELLMTVGIPVQSWYEQNADDLPFRFVVTSVDNLVEMYDSELEDLLSFVHDAVAFDEAMWGLYDEFTEKQVASRPRALTAYKASHDSDENCKLESDDEITSASISEVHGQLL